MATDVTTINGVALANYSGTLVAYDTGAIKLKKNYFKADRRLEPTVLKPNLPLRDVKLKVEFYRETDAQAESAASALAAALMGSVDVYLPDGYYYSGVLTEAGKPQRVSKGIIVRTFTITAYRHGALQSATLTQSGTITVLGNYKADVRYKITTSGTEFTINGIYIEGITGTQIIIDGIAAKVTENGNNCFEKTNMTEFPALEPGSQSITIDGTGTVIVEYYPIYV